MILAFGRRIYISAIHSDEPVPEDLKVHEETHCRQQGYSYLRACVWWVRYVCDVKYRYKMELEAYRAQYRHVASKVRNREILNDFRMQLARSMADPVYRGMVSYGRAFEDLKC